MQALFLGAWQGLMGRPAAQLAEPGAKHLALGLALLFLGKQDAVEATLEVRTRAQGLGFRAVEATLEVHPRAQGLGFRAVGSLRKPAPRGGGCQAARRGFRRASR